LAKEIWEKEQASVNYDDNAAVDNSRCHTCKRSFSEYFQGITITALGKKYHHDCFICVACSAPITTPTFASDSENNPIHTECYRDLYTPTCVVCKESIANAAHARGKIAYEFAKHPYFDDWKYCLKHEKKSKRCTSCGRVEPNDSKFNSLGDEGRVVCMSCVRTLVLDDKELKPIFDDALEFMDGLGIWYVAP